MWLVSGIVFLFIVMGCMMYIWKFVMFLILMIWFYCWCCCCNVMKKFVSVGRIKFVICWWMSIRILILVSMSWWNCWWVVVCVLLWWVMMISWFIFGVVYVCKIWCCWVRIFWCWRWLSLSRIIVFLGVFWKWWIFWLLIICMFLKSVCFLNWVMVWS